MRLNWGKEFFGVFNLSNLFFLVVRVANSEVVL